MSSEYDCYNLTATVNVNNVAYTAGKNHRNIGIISTAPSIISKAAPVTAVKENKMCHLNMIVTT